MVEHKIGFIGFGFMGSALAKGFIRSGIVKPTQIYASDVYANQATVTALGINFSRDNWDSFKACDVIILAVKPHLVSCVIDELKQRGPSSEELNSKLYLSIAAGVTVSNLIEYIYGPTRDCGAQPCQSRVVRVMPSQPCLVGEGCTMLSPADSIPPEDTELARKLFESVGTVCIHPETYMDAFTGIAGSAPAYVFTFIESLADAGVLHGFSRQEALEIASQIVMGSAKMVKSTETHPAILRDAVCSPGGATIAGMATMEQTGFRNSVIQTVGSVVKRCNEMTNEHH